MKTIKKVFDQQTMMVTNKYVKLIIIKKSEVSLASIEYEKIEFGMKILDAHNYIIKSISVKTCQELILKS